MTINWNAVAAIAGPIVALFVGVWINRRFESRPILVSHLGHVSSFRHNPPSGDTIQIHTHSVVLRNAGRRSATNVRLRHNFLPEFNVWPALAYKVEDLPDGSREIVIPTLVPEEEITVSYLYFPPVTFAEINAGIKCDQGFAHAIPVLLQRQYPRWLNATAGILMLIGLVAIVYFFYHLAVLIAR